VNDRRNRRGTALLFALVVLAILSIGTSVLWRQIHGNFQQYRVAWHQEQAFQLAEAGLETAIAGLRQAQGDYGGEENVPLGGGFFSVSVSPGKASGTFQIASTGRTENAAYRHDRVTLDATLTVSGDGRILVYYWQTRREGIQP
jgi:type II secretory pathway component PulK